MPKTPINENSYPFLWKHEVRFSEDPRIASPAGYFVFSEERDHFQFCVFVPAASNSRHDLRAPILVEYISHFNSSV